MQDPNKIYKSLALFKDGLSRIDQINKIRDAIVLEQARRDEENNETIYQQAVAFQEAGEYAEAIAVFQSLDGYKDSSERIVACKKALANVFESEGSYWDAVNIYLELIDYSDSLEHIKGISTKCSEEKKYWDAIRILDTISSYVDSKEIITSCIDSIKKLDQKVIQKTETEITKEYSNTSVYKYNYDDKGVLLSVESTGKEDWKEVYTYTGDQVTSVRRYKNDGPEIKYKYNDHGDILSSDNGSIVMCHEYKYDKDGLMTYHKYGVTSNFTYGKCWTYEYEYLHDLPVKRNEYESDKLIAVTNYEYNAYGLLSVEDRYENTTGIETTTTYIYSE